MVRRIHCQDMWNRSPQVNKVNCGKLDWRKDWRRIHDDYSSCGVLWLQEQTKPTMLMPKSRLYHLDDIPRDGEPHCYPRLKRETTYPTIIP